MRLFPRLPRWLLAACLMVAMPALAQVDLAGFIKLDSFSDIRLSPTGEYYAATVPLGDRTGLVVLRRSDNEVTARFALGKDTHISGFEWVNDTRLLLSMAENFGMDDTPSATGEIFGVDADGKNIELLVGYRAVGSGPGSRIQTRTQESVAAYLLDTLPDDEHEVLIEVWPFHDDPYTRVESLDIRNGKRRPVTRSPVQRGQFMVDHARQVRFVRGYGPDNASMLYHRSGEGAEWVLVNDEKKTRRVDIPVGFSADNRIAYLRSDSRKTPDALVAYDTQTGERRPLLQHEVVDPYEVLYSLGETGVPVGAQYLGDKVEQRFFDPQSPEARLYGMLQSAFEGQAVYVTSTTRDGTLALVQVTNGNNPGDFYLFDVPNRKAAYLLSRRQWIDPEAMGNVTPVALKARDGLALHGFLTLPPGSDGKKLPTVVYVHGGPFGRFDRLEFDTDAQILAKAGYAVLQVNFRGSGNYGRGFQEAGAQEWGKAMQDDVTDATRWAVEQGIADPKRICIHGGSYGAYAAMMGVAREPDLYACAAGYVGVYDLDLMVRQDSRDSRFMSSFSSQWVGKAGGLAEVSPTRLADRIKAPVFLAAGGEDRVAPVEHTELMEKALRKAGVPVETLVYKNEGHGFYKEEHRTEYYRRLLAFLSRHLGGAQAR
ncbi:peptidase S9 [Arenimonas soli]|uniref:Peptidase S9 n=1 Tax=Arenimonas soli TaxID=2269504 RepID=A0ABQ1HHB9_9GAMM|nr:S9 family peptidase [Arenimonas soli]GGA77751.1 peptidase S9 [Arenimonas soli]